MKIAHIKYKYMAAFIVVSALAYSCGNQSTGNQLQEGRQTKDRRRKQNRLQAEGRRRKRGRQWGKSRR